ncbi:dTDP-4-dehydrorhamnose 3,5-epimerase family protein [Novacetimonas cocois]|uniref:dTDP-4-dehydrorhamnose 3,5-epimerase n=1 Tax=Novacetimonas cocois TaxID=1747507 RepID=A0A365Z1I3_9PROT|nr:dTDP-4-dehydrorhamnose 3,5-epimerase family protein [Novacetimonas cocois]RBM08809.1 dTDP-4-dehydrorhamnose 3,5-epimerase [Novacetimonas cocois]
MLFQSTEINDAREIILPQHKDERGSFGRIFDRDLFMDHGIKSEFIQFSISRTRHAGTLRGMHYQKSPYAEDKLVYCIRGSIHDVICDLRPESSTYMKCQSFYLSDQNNTMIYIPAGCAHGFQTMEDNTEILYGMSSIYSEKHACGIRFDDPELGITWPRPVSCISGKDLNWPPYMPASLVN